MRADALRGDHPHSLKHAAEHRITSVPDLLLRPLRQLSPRDGDREACGPACACEIQESLHFQARGAEDERVEGTSFGDITAPTQGDYVASAWHLLVPTLGDGRFEGEEEASLKQILDQIQNAQTME